MNIEVYADGSATIATKPGGYGYVIVIDGKKHSEGSGHMENATNNDAELEGAIQGLKAVYAMAMSDSLVLSLGMLESKNTNVPPVITLVSDSQIILGWADGSKAFRQENKINKYKQLQFLMTCLNSQTRWVEGHTGDEHNERCDKLANAARLGVTVESVEIEAVPPSDTKIGKKKHGVMAFWYKNVLKIIDLDANIIENYDANAHGSRSSKLELTDK